MMNMIGCWYPFDKPFTDFNKSITKDCNKNVLTISTAYHIHHIYF